jgi:hypothetical protein
VDSKFSQICAKSSQIEPNPAKPNLGKSLDFLVGFERYQGLARTPSSVFILPARFTRIASRASRRALLFSMSSSFDCARSAAYQPLQGTMTQNYEKCK